MVKETWSIKVNDDRLPFAVSMIHTDICNMKVTMDNLIFLMRRARVIDKVDVHRYTHKKRERDSEEAKDRDGRMNGKSFVM